MRGVKEGGGGVQLPDSLMYEAVLQSAGPRLVLDCRRCT